MTAATTAFAARRAHQEQIFAVVNRLIAEFAGIHPAGTVIRRVAAVREQLLHLGIRDDLPWQVETLAGQLLSERTPPHAFR
jgi:hypothetical protein